MSTSVTCMNAKTQSYDVLSELDQPSSPPDTISEVYRAKEIECTRIINELVVKLASANERLEEICSNSEECYARFVEAEEQWENAEPCDEIDSFGVWSLENDQLDRWDQKRAECESTIADLETQIAEHKQRRTRRLLKRRLRQ